MSRSDLQIVKIGHAEISRLTFAASISCILAAARSRESKYIVTPNTDHILQLETDEELRQAYRGADLVLCDGRPLLWASKLLGTPLPEVVTGADLLPALCKFGANAGCRVALVGGPPGSAELARENILQAYPGIQVVWAYCPPLGFERNAEVNRKIIQTLNNLDCDLVFIGVGAPKQEKWIFANYSQLRVGVLLGVGAAIEFVAGTVPRAPKIFRRFGLEWSFRLFHDPKRLGKRYFKDLYFFVIVFRQWVQRQRRTKN